jgi:hypothetical protein
MYSVWSNTLKYQRILDSASDRGIGQSEPTIIFDYTLSRIVANPPSGFASPILQILDTKVV